MPTLALLLIAVAFVIAMPTTALMRSLGRRMGALDGAGVPGQVKAAARKVPNTGGLGIFLGIALPIMVGVTALSTALGDKLVEWFPAMAPHLPGLASKVPDAIVLVAGLSVLHVMGVIDDRKPLGAMPKLLVQLVVTIAVVLMTKSGLLTSLDQHVGGAWASTTLAVLWIVLITNAMNFMDNMDGLTGGVATIAGACFLAAALVHGQWFIAACLALLIGACLGFLVFNFPLPRATIFMGDAGSLVVGFVLGFLTVRTTFYDPVGHGGAADLAGGWYAVFMPLAVLAVPLYDLASVCVIRIRAGRSPLVGDLNHLSHRLVRRGLSQRDAVLVIYGLTGVTAIAGVPLGSLQPWQAVLVGVQVLIVLGVLALFEGRSASATQTLHKDRT
jgi:UDP-GlcNAc:undecaprenyl-phosphate GlcNAc-1-phosphate transferase